MVENAKFEKLKWDFLGDFQTLCAGYCAVQKILLESVCSRKTLADGQAWQISLTFLRRLILANAKTCAIIGRQFESWILVEGWIFFRVSIVFSSIIWTIVIELKSFTRSSWNVWTPSALSEYVWWISSLPLLPSFPKLVTIPEIQKIFCWFFLPIPY